MGQIVIENIPDNQIDKVSKLIRSFISVDVKSVISYSMDIPPEQINYKVVDHRDKEMCGFVDDKIHFGGVIFDYVPINTSSGVIILAPETLKQCMDPFIEDHTDVYELDEKIHFYVDETTWMNRSKMTRYDWKKYLHKHIQ